MDEWHARQLSFEAEALVHLGALFRVALHFVGNTADADDLVQDTLFRAYQAWDQFARGTNAKAWLITILRHVFIDAYHREARRRHTLSSAPPPPADARGPSFDDLVADRLVHAIKALP